MLAKVSLDGEMCVADKSYQCGPTGSGQLHTSEDLVSNMSYKQHISFVENKTANFGTRNSKYLLQTENWQQI